MIIPPPSEIDINTRLKSKLLVHTNFGSKKIGKKVRSKTFLGPITICVKRSLVQNKGGVQKLSPPKKFGSKNFGKNGGINNFDIADMDKCH